MANWFSVRVEMHGGGDYDLLHAVMHDLGFRRFVHAVDADQNELLYILPTGSYYFTDTAGTATCKSLWQIVSAVANQIEKGKKSPYVWIVKGETYFVGTETITADPDANLTGLMRTRVTMIRNAAAV